MLQPPPPLPTNRAFVVQVCAQPPGALPLAAAAPERWAALDNGRRIRRGTA